MPTSRKEISNVWTPVAQGPGQCVFSFHDDYGAFTLHTSADPSTIVAGHKLQSGKPMTLTLGSSDFLHLRGRGAASVSADTLI